MIFRYCIRTCPQRQTLCEELFQKLREHLPADVEIDIVNDDIGRAPIMVFARYIERLLASNIEFDHLVTLEDDAIFNDYLHENLCSMPIFKQPSVGCVQLSLASIWDMASPYTLYSHELEAYFRTYRLHYSCGLTMSKSFLKALKLDEWTDKGGWGFDILYTEECIKQGMLHVLQYPSLVATKPTTASTLGHSYEATDELYCPDWRLATKNAAYKKWAGQERLYGFKKKVGEPDDNPIQRTKYYLSYFKEDILEKGNVLKERTIR